MSIDVDGIRSAILAKAAQQGGHAWGAIQQAAPLYVKAYAQNIADIAEGVAAGEISTEDAEMYVKNAQLLLAMALANTSQIVLHEVQTFIDNVIGLLKGTINARLPVAIL